MLFDNIPPVYGMNCLFNLKVAEIHQMDNKIYTVMNFARSHRLPIPTSAIVMAAEESHVPWHKAAAPWEAVLGAGKKKFFISGTKTSKTSRFAREICGNKPRTSKRLARLGIPVAKHKVVYTVDDARQAATDIGFPVVLKPRYGTFGRGVTVGLTSQKEIPMAFRRAHAYHRAVIVEKFIEGSDHRLLVVGGKLVAAAMRTPAQVVGDGVSSVEQLIKIANMDIRRSYGHVNILSKIVVNEDVKRVLRLQGFKLRSVPKRGVVVAVRSVANVSAGGTSVDVTDIVHPDNQALAIRIARKLHLKIAGVDFICKDISVSHRIQGGAVCEVNATPGLRIHLTPREGHIQNVGGAIIKLLFGKTRFTSNPWDRYALSEMAPPPPAIPRKSSKRSKRRGAAPAQSTR